MNMKDVFFVFKACHELQKMYVKNLHSPHKIVLKVLTCRQTRPLISFIVPFALYLVHTHSTQNARRHRCLSRRSSDHWRWYCPAGLRVIHSHYSKRTHTRFTFSACASTWTRVRDSLRRLDSQPSPSFRIDRERTAKARRTPQHHRHHFTTTDVITA